MAVRCAAARSSAAWSAADSEAAAGMRRSWLAAAATLLRDAAGDTGIVTLRLSAWENPVEQTRSGGASSPRRAARRRRSRGGRLTRWLQAAVHRRPANPEHRGDLGDRPLVGVHLLGLAQLGRRHR